MAEPRCTHARRGIVTSGGQPGQPHAATNICDRPDCITDAIAWAENITGLPATVVPDHQPEPSLFDG